MRSLGRELSDVKSVIAYYIEVFGKKMLIEVFGKKMLEDVPCVAVFIAEAEVIASA